MIKVKLLRFFVLFDHPTSMRLNRETTLRILLRTGRHLNGNNLQLGTLKLTPAINTKDTKVAVEYEETFCLCEPKTSKQQWLGSIHWSIRGKAIDATTAHLSSNCPSEQQDVRNFGVNQIPVKSCMFFFFFFFFFK